MPKISRLVLYLSTTVLFFTVGLTISLFISQSAWFYDLFLQIGFTKQSIPTLGQGQRSFLIIVADDLTKTNPKIQSIWLAVYISNDPPITILPIYPSVTKAAVIYDPQIEESAQISSYKGISQPNQSLIKQLKARHFWWSGYILLDTVAINQIHSIYHQNSSSSQGWPQYQGTPYPIGADSEDHLSANDQSIVGNLTDKQSAITGSPAYESASPAVDLSLLFQEICADIARSDMRTNTNKLKKLYPDHLTTDIKMKILASEWKQILSGSKNFSCSFPALDEKYLSTK